MHKSNWKIEGHILVVEDDEGLNHMICSKLTGAGFETVSAVNGAEALKNFDVNRSMLLILDHILPDMTGSQVIEQLTEFHGPIPFIVITGQGDERTAVEMMKLGARDYMVKEQDFMDHLLKTVGHVVENLATERKLDWMEAQLLESEKRYRTLFENSLNGIAFHSIVTSDEGEPIDYIFLEANQAFEDLTGLKLKEITGRCASEVMPGTENSPLTKMYGRVALGGEPLSVEQFVAPLNKYYRIVVFSPCSGEFTTVFADITELRQTQEMLSEQSEEARQIEQIVATLEERTEKLWKVQESMTVKESS